jgi:RNA polymerase sigma-70 factor (ECF subfamily)
MQFNISYSEALKRSDEDVMELLQGGYDAALKIIIERYSERLKHFTYRYTHCRMDSEDLVQETFMRVYRSKHRYKRIAKFSTWLYTIAFNLTKSHYKKAQRMKTTSLSNDYNDDDMDWELPDTNYCPDVEVDQKMSLQLIYDALEELPAEFKEAVVMRDLKQMTYDEIVQITGVPMGTVKSRINRGRARIKKILEPVFTSETLFAA